MKTCSCVKSFDSSQIENEGDLARGKKGRFGKKARLLVDEKTAQASRLDAED